MLGWFALDKLGAALVNNMTGCVEYINCGLLIRWEIILQYTLYKILDRECPHRNRAISPFRSHKYNRLLDTFHNDKPVIDRSGPYTLQCGGRLGFAHPLPKRFFS